MLHTDWREHYQAAIREVNPAELVGRMREAENAIFSCLQTLTQDSESCAERQAIGEALASLRALRINALSRQLGTCWGTGEHHFFPLN